MWWFKTIIFSWELHARKDCIFETGLCILTITIWDARYIYIFFLCPLSHCWQSGEPRMAYMYMYLCGYIYIYIYIYTYIYTSPVSNLTERECEITQIEMLHSFKAPYQILEKTSDSLNDRRWTYRFFFALEMIANRSIQKIQKWLGKCCSQNKKISPGIVWFLNLKSGEMKIHRLKSYLMNHQNSFPHYFGHPKHAYNSCKSKIIWLTTSKNKKSDVFWNY